MLLSLILTIFFLTAAASALDDFEAKNAVTGQVQFKVVDENHIKVPNYHLKKTNQQSALSYLKLSLLGVKISEVQQIQTSNNSAKGIAQWTFHLNDNSNATLTITEREGSEGNVTEYSLHWPGSQRNSFRRAVCLHTSYNDAHWYQTYQSESPSFPMNFTENVPAFPTANGFSPSSSKPDVNSLVEYLFLNSDAFAVILDHNMPLFMAKSSSSTDDPQLCFSVNNTYPYNSGNQNASYLDINMSVFTSATTRYVTDWVVDKSGLIPKPTKIPDEQLFQNPVWKVDSSSSHLITEKSMMEFALNIIKHGFPSKGLILLNSWNEHSGVNHCDATMDFDRRLFPTPDQMAININRLGFSLSLQVDSTFHGNYHHLEGLLVKEALKEEHMFDSNCHPHKLDFSNAQSREYLSILLRKFHYELQLDKTHLNGFSFSSSAMQLFSDEAVQNNPQLFSKLYVETVANASQLIVTDVGFRTQHLPSVVQLHPEGKSSFGWTSLGRLVENALSVSLGGYAFISAGVIEVVTVTTVTGTSVVDEELYIRLLQATTFMPVMSMLVQSTVQPWRLSQKTQEIVKKYVDLHSQHSSLIIQLAKERLQKGSKPIIRPLWYEFPEDPKAYSIGSQFILGSTILVAPVVERGKRERTLYLPAGQWVDQHGRLYTGAKEIKVAVELDELPYFSKKTTV